MDDMRKLGIVTVAAVAVSSLAGSARADIVSVHGQARGFYIEPTVYLAKIGFAVDLQGSFEFWYSYSTTQEFSPGSFKLVSKNAAGALIDTIDLSCGAIGSTLDASPAEPPRGGLTPLSRGCT